MQSINLIKKPTAADKYLILTYLITPRIKPIIKLKTIEITDTSSVTHNPSKRKRRFIHEYACSNVDI